MTWEQGFVIDREPIQRKNVSCRDCYYYDSSDKSCSKKGYYMPMDGYFHWRTCNYFGVDSNTNNFDGKVQQAKKARERELKKKSSQSATAVKKKNTKKTGTDKQSGNKDSKNLTVTITSLENSIYAARLRSNPTETKVQIKPSEINTKSYSLIYGEQVKTLSKEIKKRLIMKYVETTVGTKKKKYQVGFDITTRKAYLFPLVNEQIISQLEKQFK